VGSAMFNIMLEESPNKIFRRICPKCADSHKDIYYRRETDVGNTNILNKILNRWDNGSGNRFRQNYNLFSTYEDAKSGSNAWQFCNASTNKGFPSECGPTSYVANQHSRFNNNSGQTHVVFLVEKGSSTPPVSATASESSTDGGDESSTDSSDSSSDNGDESPPDSGESALNNYDFYQGKDSPGKNIRNLLSEAQGAGVEYYAEWCNQQAACKGFNSNGWVKKAIRNQRRWSNINDPNKGLYVKKD